MAVVLTGRTLTRDEVTRVARAREPVAVDASVFERMRVARAVVDRSLAAGKPVYGLTTAVGVLKRAGMTDETAAAAYSRRMLRQHKVAQGPLAAEDTVRGTMVVLANGLAGGWPGVRPLVVERIVEALNTGSAPAVRTLGSVGQADLAQMADVAMGLFGDVALGPGEGLALLGNNAFATAAAALATTDADGLLSAATVAGALSLEALAANPGMLHPAIGRARPYPGIAAALTRLHNLLDGSYLWAGTSARNLQDPLTFRNLPQILGACLDAFGALDGVLAIELNASQGNPIVVVDEDRLVSVANYEILPLAAALDGFRVILATLLSVSSERTVKLLETPWSGLPTGLATSGDPSDPGLGYLGIACQALATESRLLAQPVSFELASTSHAEGIEDRTAMAGLAARRLTDMLDLATRIVAIELAVAAQAVELRGLQPLGVGTAAALALVRAVVPYLAPGDAVPDVELLTAEVRAGTFCTLAG